PGDTALGVPQAFPPSHAGMKAFIMTRIGDIALLIAIFLIFATAGTFNYSELAVKLGQPGSWASVLSGFGLLLPTALLFFGGRIHDDGPRHRWPQSQLHRRIFREAVTADDSLDIQRLTLPGIRLGHTCHRDAIHGPDVRTCQGNETYITLDAARWSLSDRHPPIQRLLDKRFHPLLSLPEQPISVLRNRACNGAADSVLHYEDARHYIRRQTQRPRQRACRGRKTCPRSRSNHARPIPR